MQILSPWTRWEVRYTSSPYQCTDSKFVFVFFPSEIKSSYFNYPKVLFLRHVHSYLNETNVQVDSVQHILNTENFTSFLLLLQCKSTDRFFILEYCIVTNYT